MNPILMKWGAVAGVVLIVLGWGWVGHKRADALQGDLDRARASEAVCRASTGALRAELDRQSAEIEGIREMAQKRREEALEARDRARADLEAAQAKYTRLRKSWPDDCISAVGQVRRELGL